MKANPFTIVYSPFTKIIQLKPCLKMQPAVVSFQTPQRSSLQDPYSTGPHL
jgi:hypothetical protein